MRILSWRLIAGICLLATCFFAASPPPAAAQTVRKSVTDLTATELMSLRRGVATMMSRNTATRNSANFRRSWIYWANMHGHFGSDIGCGGPVTGNGMTGVTTWTASNSNETATWCKCEHHNDQFLTWHRMYIWYFERVLRQAANDPNLTLPFWDYATDPMLPAAFRAATYVNENGQTVANPLRVEARRATLNDGTASLLATTVSTSNANNATTYATYRTRLESTPHGGVHCTIGVSGCSSGLMGRVASAGLDPIFYLHHANIDRLYQCWLQVDEAARLPSNSTILNRTYSFIDSDGSRRNRVVRDMLRTSQLGYGYTTGGGCPAVPVATVEARMASTELRRGVTTVPISIDSAGPADGALFAPGAFRSARVIINGLTAAVVPGVLYNVYLANDQGEREQVGVIDFFDFDAGGHGGHGAVGRRFEFDATAAVEQLGLGAGAKPNLIFEPTTGLTDSTPDVAAEAIGPDAKVSFRRARLRFDR